MARNKRKDFERRSNRMKKELKYKIRRTIFLYIPGILIFAIMFIIGYFVAY